jgi:hypothetical protein
MTTGSLKPSDGRGVAHKLTMIGFWTLATKCGLRDSQILCSQLKYGRLITTREGKNTPY